MNEQIKVVQSETAKDAHELTLEGSGIFLDSLKTQMFMGGVLILIVCLLNYWPSLHIGFLLDDFLHFDYAHRALHGDAHDLLSNLYSNWGGSDLMKSYRPLVSLTILTDYLLFGVKAGGWHVTNVLMFFLCSIFVSLITLELTGLYGNRLGAAPAIWAGLLFAAYPLHAESVCWIIGRVDLLCTLFYLISIFCLVRYRLLEEKKFLWGSFICFLLALISKEMAVTLPAIATLMLFLIPPKNRKANKTGIPLMAVAGFWLLLGAYAIFRTALLGTAVGGYGDTGHFDLHTVVNSLRNFLDRPSLYKMIVPINEELHLGDAISRSLFAGYVVALVLGIARIALGITNKAMMVLLLAWCGIALLPTFQIWHIYPNLVGSRLFFLSSAPFCILLAFLALPSADRLPKDAAKRLAILGTAALIMVFTVWSYILQCNLKPWITAGAHMRQLKDQLQTIDVETPQTMRTLILDLPCDYEGAGMLTRPQYLEIYMRPPFAVRDQNPRLTTIEPRTHGSHEFVWPSRLLSLTNDPKTAKVYRNDASTGTLLPWQPSSGATAFSSQFGAQSQSKYTIEPSEVSSDSADKWHAIPREQAYVEEFNDFIRIHPGDKPVKNGMESGLTLWLDTPALSATGTNTVELEMSSNSNKPVACSVVWQSEAAKENSLSGSADLIWRNSQSAFAWVGRYRSWTLGPPIKRIGLRFPAGEYYCDLKRLSANNDDPVQPTLKRAEGTPGSMDTMFVNFDAGTIPNRKSLRFYFSHAGDSFDADSPADIATAFGARTKMGSVIVVERTERNGPLEIPVEVRAEPGLHQVQAVAVDKDGSAIGLPSEPLDIYITPTK